MISLRSLAVSPLLFAGPLLAQGVLPGQPFPAPAQQPQAQPSTNVSGTAGNYSSSTAEGMSDRLFDVKSDSVDLENGTIQWKGKTFNLGDTRLMRARFERYLAAPPPEKGYEEYVKLMGEISRRLSAMNFSDTEKNRMNNLQEAWNLLFEAAKYEYDGNASITLANQVMKAWRERNELGELSVSMAQQRQLLKEKDDQLFQRADIKARKKLDLDEAAQAKKKGAKPTDDEITGSRDIQAREEARATDRVALAKDAVQAGVMGVQSKLEFQSTIIGYLTQRRFQHCLLASAFYRQIYKASQQQVQVGAKEMKDLFPISDFVPSLESVDAIAREAIGDVGIGLRTFRQLDGDGDRYAAFERLQETYFLGEYEPAIIRLDYASKHTYTEMARDVRDLQRFGDERDLDAADETLARICAVAKDFPAARIRSKIRTAKQASDMAVLAAKQAALINGKDGADKVAENLALAAKIWPLNPGIKGFMTDMTNRADLVSQRMPEFDKLYDAGKYRELYDRKEEFAVALLQDKPRLDKLNAVINRVGKIEALAAQADALAGQGNRYLAWDFVMEAERADPTDPKVAGLRSKLAPQVADYAKLLADAARAETEGRSGPSLAAYLAAQDLNRGSKFCQDALDRVSRATLEALPTGGK